MPLTDKGRTIMASMKRTYPTKEKAEQVFYASKNAGTISGVDRRGSLRRHTQQARRTK